MILFGSVLNLIFKKYGFLSFHGALDMRRNRDRDIDTCFCGTTKMVSVQSTAGMVMCAFDCGPVLWSKKGFVHFSQVKKRMNQIGWPYRGCPSQVLRPLYRIGLNYRRPPIRRRGDPDEGYSLKSLRSRACQIYEIIDNLLNEINRIRNEKLA